MLFSICHCCVTTSCCVVLPASPAGKMKCRSCRTSARCCSRAAAGRCGQWPG
jgi:hypothetical protein